ncbi:MAG TPA: FG-GAP-like repeat-containing protein, partial [Bacteroidales bacterium]|nr:FG-GAP-like repeat-containing protein [Bacteroidales bacterium]
MSRNAARYYLPLVLLSVCTAGKAQSPQVLWNYELNDAAFGNAALADVDNDGYPEVVFSCYRNDSSVYMLNAEDGSLLWKYNTGGCNDVAPLIIDTDGNGDLEVILPSSCVAKTFCLDADSGYVQWEAPTRGSDSPPTAGDVDNDGKLEILHGEFGGYVICLNAESGSQLWELPLDLNSWIQTAPALLDVDQNGQLDFVVANWSFGSNHRVWAVRADNAQILWTDTLPDDYIYHGAAFADLDHDSKAELTIGSYDGKVYCYNAEDGSLAWDYNFPSGSNYIGAPTSIGDLDRDGWPEVVFIDGWKVGVLEHNGVLKWSYTIPSYGQSFRGAALADMNSDDTLDVVFGTTTGKLFVLHGATGALLHTVDLASHVGSADFEIDHGPVVADFDLDGDLEVFVVGGHAEYPNVQNNWGRAYAVSFPGASAP